MHLTTIICVLSETQRQAEEREAFTVEKGPLQLCLGDAEAGHPRLCLRGTFFFFFLVAPEWEVGAKIRGVVSI
jgi:hypothetical protein